MQQDFKTHLIGWLEKKGVRQKQRGAWILYEAILEKRAPLAFSYDSLSPRRKSLLEMDAAPLPFQRSDQARLLAEMLRLNRIFILRDGFGLKVAKDGERILLQKRWDSSGMSPQEFRESLERFLANGRKAREAFQRLTQSAPADEGAPKVYL